jgi:hypothetical protein
LTVPLSTTVLSADFSACDRFEIVSSGPRVKIIANPCIKIKEIGKVRLLKIYSLGSSVSIVSGYGLDDWGSISDGGRGFFF